MCVLYLESTLWWWWGGREIQLKAQIALKGKPTIYNECQHTHVLSHVYNPPPPPTHTLNCLSIYDSLDYLNLTQKIVCECVRIRSYLLFGSRILS